MLTEQNGKPGVVPIGAKKSRWSLDGCADTMLPYLYGCALCMKKRPPVRVPVSAKKKPMVFWRSSSPTPPYLKVERIVDPATSKLQIQRRSWSTLSRGVRGASSAFFSHRPVGEVTLISRPTPRVFSVDSLCDAGDRKTSSAFFSHRHATRRSPRKMSFLPIVFTEVCFAS